MDPILIEILVAIAIFVIWIAYELKNAPNEEDLWEKRKQVEPPPKHWNCRCSSVPFPKHYDELEEYNEKIEQLIEELNEKEKK